MSIFKGIIIIITTIIIIRRVPPVSACRTVTGADGVIVLFNARCICTQLINFKLTHVTFFYFTDFCKVPL